MAGEPLDYPFDGHGYFTLVEESDDDEPDVWPWASKNLLCDLWFRYYKVPKLLCIKYLWFVNFELKFQSMLFNLSAFTLISLIYEML